MRLLFICSYLGKNYFGFQKQTNQNSVQEEIEKAFSIYFNKPIHIYASGRTDRGVNAFGQTFHVDIIKKNIKKNELLYSLNSLLPKDIKLINFKHVNDDFHARFSIKKKIYEYHIYLDSKNPFLNDFTYLCKYQLDIKKIKEAAKLFVGTNNFKNFTSKEVDELDFVRTIYSLKIKKDDKHLILTFTGNGFMRYMIRYIVGVLVEYARGKIDIDTILNSLKSESERKIISYKAPSEGLFLKKVIY